MTIRELVCGVGMVALLGVTAVVEVALYIIDFMRGVMR